MKTKTYGLQQETRQYLRGLYAYGRELRGGDIADIDEFINGCKNIDVWNGSKFWLFRNMYNMGTGSTVVCLNGDSSYNGVLVNSPTWENKGIRSTATGSPPPHIQLGNTKKVRYSSRNLVYMYICEANSVDNAFLMTCNYDLSLGSSPGEGYFGASSYMQWGRSLVYKSVSQSLSLNVPYFLSVGLQGSIALSYKNGVSKMTASPVSVPLTDTNSIRCMAMQGGSLEERGLNGVMSFVMDSNRNFSDIQQRNLYLLYKTTIGKGLGF